MAFEFFVHPERAVDFWNAVLKAGELFGVKPIGLGARDLPSHGSRPAPVRSRDGIGSAISAEQDLGVAEGGFGSYVKPYNPGLSAASLRGP